MISFLIPYCYLTQSAAGSVINNSACLSDILSPRLDSADTDKITCITNMDMQQYNTRCKIGWTDTMPCQLVILLVVSVAENLENILQNIDTFTTMLFN